MVGIPTLAYKIDIIAELKAHGYNTNKIRKERLLSEGVLQSLREDKPISLDSLGKICNLLHCNVGDLLCHIYYNDRER